MVYRYLSVLIQLRIANCELVSFILSDRTWKVNWVLNFVSLCDRMIDIELTAIALRHISPLIKEKKSQD
jgi:hypothetical protein